MKLARTIPGQEGVAEIQTHHLAEAIQYRPRRQTYLSGCGEDREAGERDEYKIACEISVTSTDQQELANIEKCVAAGYDKVILCSPKKRSLQRVKKLVAEKLEEPDQDRVLFLEPEELFFYLGEETGDEVGGEQRVKGYKVKVRHQPVKEAEERAKREAVAQVIVQALRRLRDEK